MAIGPQQCALHLPESIPAYGLATPEFTRQFKPFLHACPAALEGYAGGGKLSADVGLGGSNADTQYDSTLC